MSRTWLIRTSELDERGIDPCVADLAQCSHESRPDLVLVWDDHREFPQNPGSLLEPYRAEAVLEMAPDTENDSNTLGLLKASLTLIVAATLTAALQKAGVTTSTLSWLQGGLRRETGDLTLDNNAVRAFLRREGIPILVSGVATEPDGRVFALEDRHIREVTELYEQAVERADDSFDQSHDFSTVQEAV